MRARRYIEEPQLSISPFQSTGILQVEKPRYQALSRMGYEYMEGALGARAIGCRVLGQRELKEGVELNAFAAEAGILQDESSTMNIPGTG